MYKQNNCYQELNKKIKTSTYTQRSRQIDQNIQNHRGDSTNLMQTKAV
jgi:hypothetical protein